MTLISFDDFISKYNGKPCEVSGNTPGQGAYGQCVDLANAYISEVLGQSMILWTNAQDFPSKADKNVYDYILNSNTAIPKKGDIMIYQSPDGIGHIDICSDETATVNKFNAFSQNWPIGSVCHIISHVYTGTYKVLGWLRCKITPVIVSPPTMTPEEQNIWNFIKTNQITEGQLREGYGYVKDGTVANQSKQIDDLNVSLKSLEERISQLEADAKANNDLIVGWQGQVDTANKTISNLQAQLKTISDQSNVWKNRYEAKCQETIDKQDIKTLLSEIWGRIKLLIDRKK